MKFYFHLLIILAGLVIVSCSDKQTSTSNSQQKKKDTATAITHKAIVYEDFPVGEIIENLAVKEDPSQRFALYLPSLYNTKNLWPVIIVFDAHARAKLAVEKYKQAAEKYGYIIAASYNSKNGTPIDISASVAAKLLRDIKQRFPVDQKRIYTSGFSGGARLAAYLAIVNSGIAGSIGCGAGWPSQQKEVYNKFDYIAIAGKEDFNLIELLRLDTTLTAIGFRHHLLRFDGGHEWPPAETLSNAVLWLETNAMRDKKIPQNDSLIDALMADLLERINKSAKSKEQRKTAELYKQVVCYATDLQDLADVEKELNAVEQSAEYKKADKEYRELLNRELSDQKRLYEAFFKESVDWWKKEIEALRTIIRANKNTDRKQSAQRTLNYLSLIAYMHADNALSTGQISHAGRFLDIYYLVDPENPDCSYLWSCFHALKDNKENALGVLKKAIELGYNDAETLQSDPRLSLIRNDPEFSAIIVTIKE